jgi:hypothetical protein
MLIDVPARKEGLNLILLLRVIPFVDRGPPRLRLVPCRKEGQAMRWRLKQDLGWGLKEFRDQYTSRELLKKSLDWWGD